MARPYTPEQQRARDELRDRGFYPGHVFADRDGETAEIWIHRESGITLVWVTTDPGWDLYLQADPLRHLGGALPTTNSIQRTWEAVDAARLAEELRLSR